MDATLFLRDNGWVVNEPTPLALHDAMIAVATHDLDKAELAELLESMSTFIGP